MSRPPTPALVAHGTTTVGASPAGRAPGLRQHGFLLIEALVALAVLAISLGALLQTTNASLRGSADARIRALARELAHERLSAWQLGLLPSTALPLNGVAAIEGQDMQWRIEARADALTVSVTASGGASPLASLELPLP